MTITEYNILKAAIKGVTERQGENQYDSGEKVIRENGIKVIEAALKSLLKL